MINVFNKFAFAMVLLLICLAATNVWAKDVALVDGRVVVYAENDQVIFKRCENPIERLNRHCLTATILRAVPLLEFNNHLRFMLWSEKLHVPIELKYEVELYTQGSLYNYEVLERKQRRVTDEHELKEIASALKFKDEAFYAVDILNYLFEALIAKITSLNQVGNPEYLNIDKESVAGFETTILQAYLDTSELPMVFVRVVVDQFEMGSNDTVIDNDGKVAGIDVNGFYVRDPEILAGKRTRTVTLCKDFEMLATEVTQAMWMKEMHRNPSRHNFGARSKNHPVENISWMDVQEFIKRLNKKRDGYHYALPTEAQWEYAARAGTTGAYFFGDSVDDENVNRYAWFYDDTYRTAHYTHPVATTLGNNAFWLWDVHGNAWEWVADTAGSYATLSLTDPLNEVDEYDRHVTRGGGWSPFVTGSLKGKGRSASRNTQLTDGHNGGNGFRIIRTKIQD